MMTGQPGEMVPYLKLSVGLCCWQIWHSAAAVARSALVMTVHVAEPMHNPHLAATVAPLFVGPLGHDKDAWGKRLIWQNKSSYLFDY